MIDTNRLIEYAGQMEIALSGEAAEKCARYAVLLAE